MAFRSTSNSNSKSWLVLNFGCCASSRDSLESNDEGRAALRANGESEMRICYDQPETVAQPRAEPTVARPSTSQSMSRHVSQWVANSRDFATRASSRASVHTLSRPRASHSKSRPSIGRPMDFRHYGGVEGLENIQSMIDDAPMPVRRRRSFRPIELSIYLPDGRLSPLPDFAEEEWNTLPEMPAQALVRPRDSRVNTFSSELSMSNQAIQRKPVGSGVSSRRSSVNSQFPSRPVSVALSTLPYMTEEPAAISRPESIGSVGNVRRSNTSHSQSSTSRLLSRFPSPARSRSNTSSTVATRPGSLRRVKTDNIDEAIRELNTIVEERRASAYRSQVQSTTFPTPPTRHTLSTHVPALAPSRVMHVRSETLSDIGSAFSAPFASKPLPTLPERPQTELRLVPPSNTSGGPLTSNPVTPPSGTPSTPIQRFTTWLKRSIPTTPTSVFTSSPTEIHSFAGPSALPASRPKSTKSTKSTRSTFSTPFYKLAPASTTGPSLPPTTRPSTSASEKTLTHARQDSTETATVTLFSTSTTRPTTPALSRGPTPSPDTSPDLSKDAPQSFQRHTASLQALAGPGKARRIPAPLTLDKSSAHIEPALPSSRSIHSIRSINQITGEPELVTLGLRPPMSPNYDVLRGMERTGRGVSGEVGVAF
ncbi:hypothetical protein BU24DRAFT_427541 [Aaosphaeria arxii CBS 175.79]|uniref:Uncharacterized protein n=1 Tax=Aaosphaeria arxii CBS 175.79 TaxID=1450172 RepID=A0A6A5XBY0_9PLEO|nr:uncharacterized protein BU24DRAFT_427541 [Aaosphaeria arxii CBS 175.79]KAF2010413.1 hypothetical protein BU24DRAFT_427541 [Aaosphaeria arxii CBS 175.79]